METASRASLFASALRFLLDGGSFYTRAQWAVLLNVEPTAITQWLADESIPSPETLRAIYRTVMEDPRIKSDVIRDFEDIADQPSRQISPHATRLGASVRHYMMKPLIESLLDSLNTIHPLLQEQVLFAAGHHCGQLNGQPPSPLEYRRKIPADYQTTAEYRRKTGNPLDNVQTCAQCKVALETCWECKRAKCPICKTGHNH